MKVAPSTSALPAGSSERGEMVGQDAVLDRAEQRADDAEQNSATNSTGTECRQKPAIAISATPISRELEPLRHQRLVVAVGHLAAERRTERSTAR